MSKRPHYLGHRQRLRERLMRDARSMADYEVLELLLAHAVPRRDTKPLAKALLERFGTLRGVLRARTRDLMAVDGFGPGLAAFWTLWNEVRARVEEAPVAERTVLGSPAEVADWGIARLGGKAREEVWAALVDNQNRLVAWERIGQGTPDSASAPVREVLALALAHEASGLVLVHNHPGGDPRPSEGDLEYTRRVMRSARDLGVRLLDHLIVTEDRYVSLREDGLL
jgi:DNA repair protein RadC